MPAAPTDEPWPVAFDAADLAVDKWFAADPSSVTRARHLAGVAVAGRPVRADVETVVSELTTNALRHAGTAFRLRVSVLPHAVLVKVEDENPGGVFDPPLTAPAVEAADGRGLALVSALAASWGVRAAAGAGTCVWAVLAT
jgi:anti-sigma regulatory factor (Ser/Thr protein kinase)